MAKQSFVTGQVLTAAQLTSLQQTAMSGGAASAKTTSYVLVAADAGTAISMTSTSATTITVNTGLFAAGDTVFIQNLGTANLTITAGTATVNTAGSLILPQYDAGILYFVSASSAVFYDYIQVGAASPLTTKGDLYTFGTSDTRLGVGANGTTLVADSAEATGLKWAAPAGGGKVLQVVSATNSTSNTIASTSYTDTNITATITPTSATSKILVLVSSAVITNRNASGTPHGSTLLLRGATGIVEYPEFSFVTAYSSSTDTAYNTMYSVNHLDSPATTSATTYKVQAKIDTTANSASIRFQYLSNLSQIVLMEIGA
jgi:hypothetical protein